MKTIGYIIYKDEKNVEKKLPVSMKFWGDKNPFPKERHINSMLIGHGLYPFTDAKYILVKNEILTY